MNFLLPSISTFMVLIHRLWSRPLRSVCRSGSGSSKHLVPALLLQSHYSSSGENHLSLWHSSNPRQETTVSLVDTPQSMDWPDTDSVRLWRSHDAPVNLPQSRYCHTTATLNPSNPHHTIWLANVSRDPRPKSAEEPAQHLNKDLPPKPYQYFPINLRQRLNLLRPFLSGTPHKNSPVCQPTVSSIPRQMVDVFSHPSSPCATILEPSRFHDSWAGSI